MNIVMCQMCGQIIDTDFHAEDIVTIRGEAVCFNCLTEADIPKWILEVGE